MKWIVSHRADREVVPLADRHYNRQKVGSPQFAPPGRCVVFKTAGPDAFWITSRQAGTSPSAGAEGSRSSGGTASGRETGDGEGGRTMTRQFVILATPELRQRASRAVMQAPDGYILELRQPTRTLEQNARMWAMLSDIARQVEWDQGTMTPDEWKDFFTAHLRGNKLIRGMDGRGLVAIGMHTSRMTRREMGELMDLMSAFGAERGVKFTAPDQ